MQEQFKYYEDQEIRYLEYDDGGLLLNTKDVFSVLGIKGTPQELAVFETYLDLASAIVLSSGKDEKFIAWLNETFFLYNLETKERPVGWDADWNRLN